MRWLGGVLVVWVVGHGLVGCSKASEDAQPAATESPDAQARVFCSQVMGAPGRNAAASCGAAGAGKDAGTSQQLVDSVQRHVDGQVRACEEMLAPAVRAGRLALPGDVAKACGAAIAAVSWKESLTVRGVGWYLAHDPACKGAMLGKQGAGKPCGLNVECQPGLACQWEANQPLGKCAPAPGAKAKCHPPRYLGLRAEVQSACAKGYYCNLQTVTEKQYLAAKLEPGAGKLSPSAEGAFLDEELGADPLSARGNMWGDAIGDSFGSGGLGLGDFTGSSHGKGEGIGLGSVGTSSRAGQGFGSGHGRLGSRPPRVRAGATSVSGRLPPEIIQRIVRQNFGRFRLCYENGLRSNPNLQGRVLIRFVIGRDGSVSGVNGGGDLPDAGVVSCVTRAFYGLSFPQPEGGIVTVSYPIVFSPGEGTGRKAAAPKARPSGANVEAERSDSGTERGDAGAERSDAGAAEPVGPPVPNDECVPLVADGGSCWESWQCAEGLACRAGQCSKQSTIAAGGACREHTDCASGHYCEGSCKPRQKAGASCSASVQCIGACRSGRCIDLCEGK